MFQGCCEYHDLKCRAIRPSLLWSIPFFFSLSRDMLFNFLLTLAVTGAIVLVAGQTCYHPDQTSSSSDEACGFSTNYCCEPEDTCVTQGLCQDRNNHLNGALTFFEGATEPGNYTRLYKTASCTNENWSNCINHCPSSGKQSKHALARCWR